jgi:hypothetical protein
MAIPACAIGRVLAVPFSRGDVFSNPKGMKTQEESVENGCFIAAPFRAQGSVIDSKFRRRKTGAL